MSVIQQADNDKKKLINNIKKIKLYNDLMKMFPDAYLDDVILNKKDDD